MPFASLLGCTDLPTDFKPPPVPAELTLQINFDRTAKEIRFTLHNGSPDPVIVAIRQPELIAYVIRGEIRVPITWDASNANMMSLDPFGCVHLQAGDTFERSLPLWTTYSGEIEAGERIIGVTPKLTIQAFSTEYQKPLARYKQYFLDRELISLPVGGR
jgi:hypothetical protein